MEGKFCKLNAVLTFREYLEDYASPETKAVGEKVLAKELQEIEAMEFYQKGTLLEKFRENYKKICNGERDIYI